jgi:hypothetical protein
MLVTRHVANAASAAPLLSPFEEQFASQRLKPSLRRADTDKQHQMSRTLAKIGPSMLLPYCSVHERVFDPTRHVWASWSQDGVTPEQQCCDMLDSTTSEEADSHVIETACDQCVEVARQILHAQWARLNTLR